MTLDRVIAVSLGLRCFIAAWSGASFRKERRVSSRVYQWFGGLGARLSWLRRRDRDEPIKGFRLLIPEHRLLRYETDSLIAARTVYSIAAVVFSTLSVGVAGPVALPVCLIILAAAPSIPDRVLNLAATKQRANAISPLPGTLDDLATAFESGLTAEAALGKAASSAAKPLQPLLLHAANLARSGVRATAALRKTSAAANLAPLSNIAGAMERAETLGLPMASTLREAAASARSQVRSELTKRAGRAMPISGLIAAMVLAPACVTLLVMLVLGGALNHVPAVSAP